MSQLQTAAPAAPAAPTRRYHLSLAIDDDEIREAQRLRHSVFVEEMGARLPSVLPGHDIDAFDPYCDHLIVRELEQGEVVGTYRILTPESALRLGGYFCDRHFDLDRLAMLRPRMIELGRSCVHPDHRTGAVIGALWSGIVDYMKRYGYDYIVGCASISMSDGGRLAARIHRHAAGRHLAPVDWQCAPRNRLPVNELDDGLPAVLPPLIKGYLHAGARICGEPAWDPDFNTAGLLMLLPMAELKTHHARHYAR